VQACGVMTEKPGELRECHVGNKREARNSVKRLTEHCKKDLKLLDATERKKEGYSFRRDASCKHGARAYSEEDPFLSYFVEGRQKKRKEWRKKKV